MKFTEQLYRTKKKLPQPEHFIEPDGSFGVIISCWGQESSAARAIEHVIQLKNVYSQDREHTSPFSFLESISYDANRLRQNVMHLNDFLYAQDNSNDHKSAYEVLLFSRSNQEWSWASVGGPHIILNRDSKAQIIQSSMTAATRFGTSTDPLPGAALGLFPTITVSSGSIRLASKDEVIFYSGDLNIQALDEKFLKSLEIKSRVQAIVKKGQDKAFWLASLNYEGV